MNKDNIDQLLPEHSYIISQNDSEGLIFCEHEQSKNYTYKCKTIHI